MLHEPQPGAQNQNNTVDPANDARSSVPPPTTGAVNCSAAGAATGVSVEPFSEVPGALVTAPPEPGDGSLASADAAGASGSATALLPSAAHDTDRLATVATIASVPSARPADG